MDLRHLRYFVAAAEAENFTRGAQRLNVTTSALSRRIRDLEIDLGVELFARSGNHVSLTRAGAHYLKSVRIALAELESGKSIAQQSDRGAVRIAVPPSAMRSANVSGILRELVVEGLNIEVTQLSGVIETPIVDQLQQEVIDAVFAHGAHIRRISDSLARVELECDDYVLLLPQGHPLIHKDEIYLRDLCDQRFLWMQRETSPAIYDELLTTCRRGGLIPRISQHAPSETRIALVAAGAGACFALAPHWEPWPPSVVARRVADLSLPQPLDFVWRPNDRRKSLRRIVQIVTRYAEARPAAR